MRTYERIPGSRTYHNFTEEQVAEAVRAVQNGMSKKQAARIYKIPRSTLTNRCLGRHTKPRGHPTILSSEEETVIARTLGVVADWGFPLTKADIKQIMKKYLDKKGIVIPILKDNLPGDDMVALFIQRNNLAVRIASNIKRSRASVDQDDVNKFFENIAPALLESTGDHIYNYDETNITDDPGARKVIVPRNCKRVERVQNFSRTAISIMVCGTASGDLLPPMVVYKASNLYENWCVGGPTGTVYKNSPSGWFDANLFEIWFCQILLPHIQRTREPGKRVVVVGDNLASHFAPNVIRVALEHDIYLTPFPPNATHLMQPLDVAVFAPMKKKWRMILDAWRKETRYPGSIPKEQFPLLLNRLWSQIQPNVQQNLISGFRATGLYPCNPQEVIKRLPDATVQQEQVGRLLDTSLVELLQEHRGVAKDPSTKRKRGKKVEAGMRIVPLPVIADEPGDNPENPLDDQTPSTSGLEKSTRTSNKKEKIWKQSSKANTAEEAASSSKKRTSERVKQIEDKCRICKMLWTNYRGHVDWIKCCKCHKWVCGVCNEDSKDPYFLCAVCDDDSTDEDPFQTDEEEEFVP